MNREEAILKYNEWRVRNLLRHGERTVGLDFVYDLYADGYELVKKGEDNDKG